MSDMNLYSKYKKWQRENLLNEDGIIVGVDLTQEWILPWWWERYRRCNSHPVTFVDLGMSQEKKEWCKERGHYIHLPVANVFVAERKEMDPVLVAELEQKHGAQFWYSREAWFKKPLACLQSPYRRSIWLDLDCEVRQDIKGVFDLCENPLGIAIAKDLHYHQTQCYNTGVVVFKRECHLIEQWAEQAFSLNHEFLGDQDVLSFIMNEQNLQPTLLPSCYNWSRCWGVNPDAIIFHFHGPAGKRLISILIRHESNPLHDGLFF